MTFQELLTEINTLPLEERLILLETLTRRLRAELSPSSPVVAPVDQVRGLLKPAGPVPQDADRQQAYTRTLIGKYT